MAFYYRIDEVVEMPRVPSTLFSESLKYLLFPKHYTTWSIYYTFTDISFLKKILLLFV